MYGFSIRHMVGVLGVAIFPHWTFAETSSECPKPDLTPGEVYSKYLGQFDVSDLNEKTFNIYNKNGLKIGSQTLTFNKEHTSFTQLAYDLDGNFVAYGAGTVRDKEKVISVLKEAAEAVTGLDFGGNVFIDAKVGVDCFINSKSDVQDIPKLKPQSNTGGGGGDSVGGVTGGSVAQQIGEICRETPHLCPNQRVAPYGTVTVRDLMTKTH